MQGWLQSRGDCAEGVYCVEFYLYSLLTVPTSIIPTTTFPSTPGGNSKTTFDVELDTCSLCHNPNGDIYFRGLIITGKCFIFIMVSLVISWIITKFTLALNHIYKCVYFCWPPALWHYTFGVIRYFVVTEKQTQQSDSINAIC